MTNPLATVPMNAGTDEAVNAPQHRHIQSFVHRRSHFSTAQQAAFAKLMPIWGVPYSPETLDFSTLFGNDRPTVLEIGCGMGETTAAIAKACPNVNFLGIEVYNAGVATLLQRIETLGCATWWHR
jgi:tRNA (guanine-N7-)-methyltransferase